MKRRRTLRWKVSALFLVLILLTGGLHALTIGRVIRNLIHDVQAALYEYEAGRILEDLPAGLLDGPPRSEVDAWLARHVAGFPNLSVLILAPSGELLGAYRPPRWGHRSALPALARGDRTFRHAPPHHRREFEAGGARYVLVLTQEKLGRTLVSERDPYLGLWWLATLTGITALAGVLGLRLLTRRLTLLQEGVERVTAGDLSVRVEPGTDDEVGALIASVNTMVAELEQNAADLARQDQARREMLAEVSHELRTPLTTVSGHLELLGDALPADDPHAGTVRLLREEVATLAGRIQDLLTLARGDAGGLALEPEAIDLAAVVAHAVARHRDAAKIRGVALAQEVPAEPLPLEADPARLEQVLENLIQNALHATPAGGEIRVEAAPHEGGAEITVSDTGCGIPEEELDRVFERFFRGEGRRGGGTGLGLAVTRRLVELHGGEVSAASSPEGGATFRVRLPARPGPDRD